MTAKKKTESKPKKQKKEVAVVRKNQEIDLFADQSLIHDIIIKGDLKKFSEEQKVNYYNMLCKSIGLNPLTKPFDLIVLQDREILYANKSCAEQLRKKYGISIVSMEKTLIDGTYEVQTTAKDHSGRYEIATGAVSVIYPPKYKVWNKENNRWDWKDHPKAGQLVGGEELSNLKMKAETKSKRRVTLALCGLGMLDETETDFIDYPEPEAAKPQVDPRLEKLPEPVKQGFDILGYSNASRVMFCENAKWDDEAIMKKINAIVDVKA